MAFFFFFHFSTRKEELHCLSAKNSTEENFKRQIQNDNSIIDISFNENQIHPDSNNKNLSQNAHKNTEKISNSSNSTFSPNWRK